jgi:FkbM family methyltransferase
MRRSPLALLSASKLRNLRYVPRTVAMFRDWWPLLLNWSGFADRPATYRRRDGRAIEGPEGIDAASIGVVMVRGDYGPVPRDARVVFDVGANIGSFALHAALSAPSAIVYAFEPLHSTFDVLVRNIERNGLGDRIRPTRAGLAASCGTRTLHISSNSVFNSLYGGAAGGDVEVACVSIERFMEDEGISAIDLFKIDCEGCEYEVLYQMSTSRLAAIHSIRMEYHRPEGVEGGNIDSLANYLAEHGFAETLRRVDGPSSGIAWFEHF